MKVSPLRGSSGPLIIFGVRSEDKDRPREASAEDMTPEEHRTNTCNDEDSAKYGA